MWFHFGCVCVCVARERAGLTWAATRNCSSENWNFFSKFGNEPQWHFVWLVIWKWSVVFQRGQPQPARHQRLSSSPVRFSVAEEITDRFLFFSPQFITRCYDCCDCCCCCCCYPMLDPTVLIGDCVLFVIVGPGSSLALNRHISRQEDLGSLTFHR